MAFSLQLDLATLEALKLFIFLFKLSPSKRAVLLQIEEMEHFPSVQSSYLCSSQGKGGVGCCGTCGCRSSSLSVTCDFWVALAGPVSLQSPCMPSLNKTNPVIGRVN